MEKNLRILSGAEGKQSGKGIHIHLELATHITEPLSGLKKINQAWPGLSSITIRSVLVSRKGQLEACQAFSAFQLIFCLSQLLFCTIKLDLHIKISITFKPIVYTVLTAKNDGTVAAPPTFTTQLWSSFYPNCKILKQLTIEHTIDEYNFQRKERT